MEPLDLTSHDPEEFEGKLVSYNGCDYQIGPFLGTGAEKIVNKLINRQSGLCLHVIKFWRDPQMHASLTEYTNIIGTLYTRFSKTKFKGVIPNFVEVRGHGGVFELQHYSGPFEDKATESYLIWEKAGKLLDISKFTEAVSLYQQILKINPFHTPALLNLASAKDNLGDIHSAFDILITVNEIEPNYFLYQQSYIYLAAKCGFIRISLNKFEEMKSQFVYQHDCDVLGVKLYLEAGYPEKANELLKGSALDTDDMKNLKKVTKSALLSKERARLISEQARNLVQSNRLVGVLESLEKAYSIYDKDPLLTINLGLALSRSGNLKRSGKLLVSVVNIIPVQLAKVCYANVAFNEIKSSNFELAILLLETVMSQIIVESGGNEPTDIWILPGIAIWIDKTETGGYGIIEEPIDTALKLINSAIKHYSNEKQVPEPVRHLAALYERANREMKRLNQPRSE